MKKFFTNNIDDFNDNRLNNILAILLFISIIIIPLDNLPYCKNILGELSVRGPVYSFILAILISFIYFLKKKKIYFDYSLEKVILIIFILWTSISAIVNIQNIANSSFKGRSGISKLILQIMVVGFMVAIYYITEFIVTINQIKLETIRKYIFISYIFVAIYAVMELLHIYKIIDLEWLLLDISYLVHQFNRAILYGDRVRSITGEASFLGMYVAFAFPWIVSYIFTEKNNFKKLGYGFASALLIFIVFATKSRTAYAVLMGEIALVFVGMVLFNKEKSKKILAVLVTIMSVVLIMNCDTISNFLGSLAVEEVKNTEQQVDDGYDFNMSVGGVVDSLSSKTSHSNIARLGLQKSALKMGNVNPIFGVGLGQFGFYADRYLAEETRVSFEIQRWTDPNETEFWPPAFALYPRIVAEQGYVGILIWLTLLAVVSIKFLKYIISKKENSLEILVLVSFAGVVVSSLNADTYALPQFWILLGLIIPYSNKLINQI